MGRIESRESIMIFLKMSEAGMSIRNASLLLLIKVTGLSPQIVPVIELEQERGLIVSS